MAGVPREGAGSPPPHHEQLRLALACRPVPHRARELPYRVPTEIRFLPARRSNPGTAEFCAVWSLPALAARTDPTAVASGIPAVATGINATAGLWQSRKKVFRFQSRGAKARTHLLAQTLEALLLRQKNEAVPQAQDCEWSAISQSKIFAELLGNGKLSFLADLGSCQIFESGIMRSHGR